MSSDDVKRGLADVLSFFFFFFFCPTIKRYTYIIFKCVCGENRVSREGKRFVLFRFCQIARTYCTVERDDKPTGIRC